MSDLQNPRVIVAKGLMFLAIGNLAAILLILQTPTIRTLLLLALTVWGFARFYYFAFYVIQNYVDAEYRFSGLWSFVQYLWARRWDKKKPQI